MPKENKHSLSDIVISPSSLYKYRTLLIAHRGASDVLSADNITRALSEPDARYGLWLELVL